MSVEGGEGQAGLQALLAEVDQLPAKFERGLPRFLVVRGDALEVAGVIARSATPSGTPARVALLNIGNGYRAGNGYKEGWFAVEEEIYCRSDLSMHMDPTRNAHLKAKLLAAQQEPTFAFDANQAAYGQKVQGLRLDGYRVPQMGALYAEGIQFFRSGQHQVLPSQYRFTVDVVTSAPVDFTSRARRGHYDSIDWSSYEGDEDGTQRMKAKIQAQAAASAKRGVLIYVASAYGCGNMGNDPDTVARLYTEVFQEPRFCRLFQAVVFAIIDHPQGVDKAKIFADCFAAIPGLNSKSWLSGNQWEFQLPSAVFDERQASRRARPVSHPDRRTQNLAQGSASASK